MNENKVIRRFSSHEEQKAEIYRYWNSQPAGVRLAAVWDATACAYAWKGSRYDPTRRSEATLTRVQRTRG
jgi:ribosomal protein L37AE/L43A